ncbi:glycosyltransferase family 2 protein [Herpetosiphon llansteffanensis]|uniref:glycosyltransferase family 2 protein n=1 Tax=Herpetosiphon llansteffanensis TaxID=2094568 RepID=UPI000D7BF311|nr:glycosyltransferase family 2 protein [Herpetosiphon llansteffanensis]
MSHGIDILIPNYNGAQLLAACLDSLRQQTRNDFLITVIDDASPDGSVPALQAAYPEVNWLIQPSNQGFVAAVNRGFQATNAPWVILLNNDTEVGPNFVAALIDTLERFPAYDFAAAKMLLYSQPDHLHTTGDGYDWNGVPWSRGVWQPDHGQYDAISEVFGPCAGAAAYKRASLQQLVDTAGNLLDPLLVMYCEDVDLNLRARRAGMRTLFVPQARVLHHLSATGGGVRASYYCGRNFILLWLRHMPIQAWPHALPAFLWSQLTIFGQALRHWRGEAARARLRGQWAGLRLIPRIWRERKLATAEAQRLLAWLGR